MTNAEISRERRESLREAAESCISYGHAVPVPQKELRALLDITDERDRFRAMLERIAAGPRRDSVTQCEMAQEALNGSQS